MRIIKKREGALAFNPAANPPNFGHGATHDAITNSLFFLLEVYLKGLQFQFIILIKYIFHNLSLRFAIVCTLGPSV